MTAPDLTANPYAALIPPRSWRARMRRAVDRVPFATGYVLGRLLGRLWRLVAASPLRIAAPLVRGSARLLWAALLVASSPPRRQRLEAMRAACGFKGADGAPRTPCCDACSAIVTDSAADAAAAAVAEFVAYCIAYPEHLASLQSGVADDAHEHTCERDERDESRGVVDYLPRIEDGLTWSGWAAFFPGGHSLEMN